MKKIILFTCVFVVNLYGADGLTIPTEQEAQDIVYDAFSPSLVKRFSLDDFPEVDGDVTLEGLQKAVDSDNEDDNEDQVSSEKLDAVAVAQAVLSRKKTV